MAKAVRILKEYAVNMLKALSTLLVECCTVRMLLMREVKETLWKLIQGIVGPQLCQRSLPTA